MESGGKTGKHIGAGAGHFAHHIDLDGADLAQAQAHFGAGFPQTSVDGRQALLQVAVSLFDGFTAQVQRAQHVYVDASFRGDGLTNCGLVMAEDINDHLISGAQLVVARGGHILAGGKVHGTVTEDIPAKNLHFSGSDNSSRLYFLISHCIHGMLAALILDHALGFCTALTLLVQGIHSFGLGTGNAAEAQFGHHVVTAFAGREGLLDIFEDLGIGHSTLCQGNACHKEKAGTDGRYTSFDC